MSIFDAYVGLDTIKYAAVSATADGDNTAVAATAGKKIRVLGYALIANAAGTVILKDSGTTYATFAFAANGGASYVGGLACPAFETGAGLALVINNGTGVDTLGHLSYILV